MTALSTRRRVLGAACLVLLRACPLSAEPERDSERARALFKEGRALATSGHYEEACPKFEQSLKLDVGIGTKFNLADCLEHVGRTATARALFLEVAALAHQSGQAEREQAAAARADALESQIHTLVIDVKVAPPKLEIRRDGAVVEPARWGAPEPVDPGVHEVIATAPGRKPWKTRLEVPLSGDVTLELPELEAIDEAPVAVAPAAPEKERPMGNPPAPEAHSAAPRGSDNIVPIILYAGIGAGALLAGTGLILYKMSNDQATDVCPKSVDCTPNDVARHDHLVGDARAARGLAYVGLAITGASLITGGVIAFVRTRKDSGVHTGISAGPVVGPGALGAAMQGRF